MRGILRLAAAGWLAMSDARVSPGTVLDDAPLVVLYYENWAGWVRNFSPSHVEKNILSRNMPVRNFVLNYAFYTWNFEECSLIAVDSIDLQKGDKGGWTPDDWNIDSLESWATSKPMGGHLPSFMMLKSMYPHIKLLPSIGGWSRSHTFHDCLINKMDHMIDSVMDHVAVWGWDGIDLDWEYPNCDGKPCGCQNEAVCLTSSGFSNVAGPGDWDRYKKFVHAVRLRFNDLEEKLGRRLYITAALGMNPKLVEGGNDQWSVGIPMEWICGEDDMDWVNLMAYDFYGPWAQLTGPLAPLYPNPKMGADQMSIDDSLTRMLKRCNRPEKLTMGLATYGKAWQQVPNTGDVPGLWQTSTASDPRGGGTWERGTLSYFDIKHNILPGCTETFDEVSKTPTAHCPTLPLAPSIPYDPNSGAVPRGQPNTFISFENGRSWKEKMAYARQKGMAGAIIWAASDTGSGEAYAPDSTVDLFEGLFEGWFGTKTTLPATTKLAPSPGSLTRWADYPCPLVTGWSPGAKAIDMSRCAGKTYTPGQTYLTIPTMSQTSDIGKNKILIHPLSGAAPATTAAPTTTAAPATTTTPATQAPTTRPVPTAAPTTSAAQNCYCKCPDTTTPAPTFAPVTTRAPATATTQTPAASTQPNATPKPTTPPRKQRTCPVKTTKPPKQSNGLKQNYSAAAIQDCRSHLAADPPFLEMCQRGCQIVIDRDECSRPNSGPEIARCVADYFPYCRTK